MKTVLVLYATRDGHTRRIAEHIAETLRERGLDADVRNAHAPHDDLDLSPYAAAVLAAPVYAGRHQRDIAPFITRHRDALRRMPTAFLSVSLTEATAEDAKATPQAREQAADTIRQITEATFATTGWRPDRVLHVAGALLYTQYGFIVRFVMKRIARKAGGDTDTSRDHIYTDWAALDRFVDTLADDLAPAAEPASPALLRRPGASPAGPDPARPAPGMA